MRYTCTHNHQDEYLLRLLLAFGRLVTVWMLRLASPAYAATRRLTLPLPEPCPWAFRLLPVGTDHPE